jgi:hypothetical protein
MPDLTEGQLAHMLGLGSAAEAQVGGWVVDAVVPPIWPTLALAAELDYFTTQCISQQA